MSMDFEMFAGDTKTLEVTAKDGSGAVVDISDPTSLRWALSRNVNAPALVSKAEGSGITVIDGAAGRFNVQLASEDTEDLRGSFYHEAEVVLSDGTVATVLSGAVTIAPTLIKPA